MSGKPNLEPFQESIARAIKLDELRIVNRKIARPSGPSQVPRFTSPRTVRGWKRLFVIWSLIWKSSERARKNLGFTKGRLPCERREFGINFYNLLPRGSRSASSRAAHSQVAFLNLKLVPTRRFSSVRQLSELDGPADTIAGPRGSARCTTPGGNRRAVTRCTRARSCRDASARRWSGC